MHQIPLRATLLATFLFLGGCLGMPPGVAPVQDFELERYLGRWYEIARLDHSFEHGLSRVTAEYSLREDGGVRVMNRGFDAATGSWDEAEGRAYFVEDERTGYLKVSFFGPFYGSYVVTELERAQYSHALVTGPDTSYLWILSRTPSMEPEVLQALVARAEALGFATDELIYVEQDTGQP